jgi:hypothetical protein
MTICKIVGAHFRPPAKAILGSLGANCPLAIVPEPHNQYDSNALAVFVATSDIMNPEHCDTEQLELLLPNMDSSMDHIQSQEGWHLGYIPRDEAAVWAPLMGGKQIPGKLGFNVKGEPAVVFDLAAGAISGPLIDDSELDTAKPSAS